MEREYTCIVCPMGCQLLLKDENNIICVTGNKCPRGEVYAKEEHASPKRVVTATCRSDRGIRIPVKSDKPVPKELIFDLLKEIYQINVKLPVKLGDIIIENYNHCAINIIATRSFL